MTQRFRGINPEDYGISDIGAREAIMALNSAIRRAFEDVDKKGLNGDKITVTLDGKQQKLDDAIRKYSVPIGTVQWMYISWAKALTLRKYGWEICDGDNGTPPLIERREQATLQRFIRSVKHGYDPWTADPASPNTGGASSASISAHTVTISDHSITIDSHSLTISNHDTHDPHFHTTSAATSGSVLEAPLEVNTNEPTDVAASADHTHDITSTSDTADAMTHSAHVINGDTGTASITHNQKLVAHSIVESGGTSSTLSHNSVATIPPYVECIPMMKVR